MANKDKLDFEDIPDESLNALIGYLTSQMISAETLKEMFDLQSVQNQMQYCLLNRKER